jgi:hypothetical protein
MIMASREVYAEALKIKLVMDSAERLDFMDWVGTRWATAQLANLFTDMGDARDAVVLATRTVLANERRALSGANEEVLRNSLTDGITARDAVLVMFAADSATAPAGPRNP